MSILQDFVNSLVEVIVNYHEWTQPGNKHKEVKDLTPIDQSLLKESPETLLATLTHFIITSLGDATRKPFLEYLNCIIQTIKPIANQEQPLKALEVELIRTILTDFINHTQILLPLSHSRLKSIEYDGQKINAYGLTGGYWQYVRTAQLLFKPLSCFPGLDLKNHQKYSLKDIEDSVEKIITNHQEQACRSGTILEEQKTFATEKQKLELESQALRKQIAALTQENLLLQKRNEQLLVQSYQLRRELNAQTSKEPAPTSALPAYNPPPTPSPLVLNGISKFAALTGITRGLYSSFFPRSNSQTGTALFADEINTPNPLTQNSFEADIDDTDQAPSPHSSDNVSF